MSAEATAPVVVPAPELPNEEPTSVSHDNQTRHASESPPHDDVQPVPEVAHGLADYTQPHASPKPIGLHSPPDSNSALKLDGSDDSELSDVEDPTLEPGHIPFLHAESATATQPNPEDEDISDVTPDHWSGTVPVFKPDMRQFKDFKKFVRRPCVKPTPSNDCTMFMLLTGNMNRWKRSIPTG